MDPDPHQLAPDALPTPFTAAEIRDALRTGVSYRILVEAPDGSRTERVSRYRDGDDDGVTVENAPADAPEDASAERTTWRELQEHASFPADRASRRRETIDHPLGRLECLRYDVTGPNGSLVFWFAVAHPGMPIRYELPGEGGVTRTTVIEVARS